jgi:membrane-associated phospholipid phosphatase
MLEIALAVAVAATLLWPVRGGRRRGAVPLRGTSPHWRRMYGRRSFLKLGGALLAAGGLAYSGADEALEEWHAQTVRGPASDGLARLVKPQGERFWFLVWLVVAALDGVWRSSAFSRWGRRNFEAMLVGLPTLWTLQYGLGSSRPQHENADPRWHPLAHSHGASGHTFIAAVPWLNLAHRLRIAPGRIAARAGSLLTGWSRLNDRSHYPSQVLLGWVVAWNATTAVAPPAEAPADGTRSPADRAAEAPSARADEEPHG